MAPLFRTLTMLCMRVGLQPIIQKKDHQKIVMRFFAAELFTTIFRDLTFYFLKSSFILKLTNITVYKRNKLVPRDLRAISFIVIFSLEQFVFVWLFRGRQYGNSQIYVFGSIEKLAKMSNHMMVVARRWKTNLLYSYLLLKFDIINLKSKFQFQTRFVILF